MKTFEVVTIQTYDGTMESLELMVQLLDLKSTDYHFDIATKEIYLHKLGLRLLPGDVYHSKRKPERFEAIT